MAALAQTLLTLTCSENEHETMSLPNLSQFIKTVYVFIKNVPSIKKLFESTYTLCELSLAETIVFP